MLIRSTWARRWNDHCKCRFEIAIARGGDHNEFLPCRPCDVLHVAQFIRCIRTVRIGNDGNYADIRNKLAHKLKPLHQASHQSR